MGKDSNKGGLIFILIFAGLFVLSYLLVNVIPLLLDFFAIICGFIGLIGFVGIIVSFINNDHNEIFYIMFFGGLFGLVICIWLGSSLDSFISANSLNKLF